MRARHVLVSLVLAAVTAAPAMAQSRQELDRRLRAVEIQLIEMQQTGPDDAAVRNMERINALEEQNRGLTGQVEELQFRNRQLERELETLREDMMSAMRGPMGPAGMGDFGAPGELSEDGEDFAIVDPDDPFAEQRRQATQPLGQRMESTPDNRRGVAQADSEGGLDMQYARTGDAPSLLFARGRTRLFDGNFSDALAAFAEFLDVAPDDARASEAWFWVGSIYRTEDQPQQAAEALIRSLELDDRSAVAPEAMVHLGAALAEMGQRDGACQTLAEARRRYPQMDPSVRNAAAREARNAGC